MGELRLFFSLCVVIFHTSGYLGYIGYAAVFCFIILSGYGNTASLEKGIYLRKYWKKKIKKIYLPYCIGAVVMIILWIFFHNSVPEAFPYVSEGYGFTDLFKSFIYDYRVNSNKWLLLNAFPKFIPQAWTDPVFFWLYAIAPFIVMAKKKSKWYYGIIGIISLAVPVLSLVLGYDFPTCRYRSVFCLIVYYYLGGVLYYVHPKLKKINYNIYVMLLLEALYIVYFACTKEKPIELVVIGSFILAIPMILMSSNCVRSHADDYLANLSYYVYLTHFISIAIWKIFSAQVSLNEIAKPYYVAIIVLLTLCISILCIFFEKTIGSLKSSLGKRQISS